MYPLSARQGGSGQSWVTRSFATGDQGRKPCYPQPRVSFPRGTEVGIDPEMQLHTLNTEPHAASTFQLGRLGNLDQAENTHVERAGRCLTARRHSELHVVERDETPRGIRHLISQG
jgi:hypothetical protein